MCDPKSAHKHFTSHNQPDTMPRSDKHHRLQPTPEELGKREQKRKRLITLLKKMVEFCQIFGIDMYFVIKEDNEFYRFKSNDDPNFPPPDSELVKTKLFWFANNGANCLKKAKPFRMPFLYQLDGGTFSWTKSQPQKPTKEKISQIESSGIQQTSSSEEKDRFGTLYNSQSLRPPLLLNSPVVECS